MHADARCPSSKKQFKQQRQQRQRQRRLKNDAIFNLRISREFRFNQFFCTVALKRVQFEILLICLSFHWLTHYMTKTIIDITLKWKIKNFARSQQSHISRERSRKLLKIQVIEYLAPVSLRPKRLAPAVTPITCDHTLPHCIQSMTPMVLGALFSRV